MRGLILGIEPVEVGKLQRHLTDSTIPNSRKPKLSTLSNLAWAPESGSMSPATFSLLRNRLTFVTFSSSSELVSQIHRSAIPSN
jgi:hypothetical protein